MKIVIVVAYQSLKLPEVSVNPIRPWIRLDTHPDLQSMALSTAYGRGAEQSTPANTAHLTSRSHALVCDCEVARHA